MDYDDNEDDWKLDRYPKLKEELEEHGFAVVDKKTIETSQGLLSCVFWAALFLGLPMIVGGLVTLNTSLGIAGGVVGAGAGVVLAAFTMSAATAYYDKKRKAKGESSLCPKS